MGSTTNVIMPALGMSQDSGKLVHWIKKAGEQVVKGEPLMEVETDKATVEIESPASGILTQVTAQEGDEVPVAQVIAVIQEGEVQPSRTGLPTSLQPEPVTAGSGESYTISPLAARIAAEHQLDVKQVKPGGGKIEKADVLAYLSAADKPATMESGTQAGKQVLASPKARQLASERGIDLASVSGSGPEGAVLVGDLPSTAERGKVLPIAPDSIPAQADSRLIQDGEDELPMSAAWGRMIERISSSWPSTPHFYLMREVNASRLIEWRQTSEEQTGVKITYTDLLVKLSAMALRRHPHVNAHYQNKKLLKRGEINIGVAVATDDGLLVPVIRRADSLRLVEISDLRAELVKRARDGKLRPEDLQGGTFTISNLGMYGVDAFNAMVNPGQAAILAVGRIVERAAAVNGQVVVQPSIIINASFDHRVVDGARGAQFLKTLVEWIEEPLSLLN